MHKPRRLPILSIATLVAVSACAGTSERTSDDGAVDGSPMDAGVDAARIDAAATDAGADTGVAIDASSGDAGMPAFPIGNGYSWNGSWSPAAASFPLPGLYDDEYFDGHLDASNQPTPILPPGAWDWSNPSNDLANYRNFDTNLGSFSLRSDAQGHAFGWQLVPNVPAAADYSGPAAYFEGSSGADRLVLGAMGTIHSFGSGSLGDGPDELVFERSWSLDFRTGSSLTGAQHDDDLLIAGCGANTDGSWDVQTSSFHMGPGSDWAFVRDISAAAIDLGNGASGRTDTIDAQDGDDLLVLRGNTHDFRVFGGGGADVVFWSPDDNVQTTTWLGPNFFGGGGAGAALFGDPSVDRLVLAIPTSTTIVGATPTPNGGLLVRRAGTAVVLDAPTQADPFAAYCIECGLGPSNERTMILEYVATDGHVMTGYFYVTAFEELQVGVGPGAVVYAIDAVAGTVSALAGATPSTPPVPPASLCP